MILHLSLNSFRKITMTGSLKMTKNGTIEVKETREKSLQNPEDIYRLHEELKATLGSGDLRY
jgi:hypothetical protein